MEKSIEDRRSEHVVAEDLAPLSDELISSDEEAAFLVAPSNELEEEMRRSRPRYWEPGENGSHKPLRRSVREDSAIEFAGTQTRLRSTLTE